MSPNLSSSYSMEIHRLMNQMGLNRDNLCFLVGAGVSAAPPSCLPLASALVGELVNSALQQPGMPKCHFEDKPLLRGRNLPRFELMMSYVQTFLDPELWCLDALRYASTPNFNHALMAMAIARGIPVLTTNFDTLIEQACVCNDFRQVIDDEQFKREDTLHGLHKLHGSFWRHTDTGWQDSTKTVCAALETIGRRGSSSPGGLGLNRLLQKAIFDHDLVVAGYSGQI